MKILPMAGYQAQKPNQTYSHNNKNQDVSFGSFYTERPEVAADFCEMGSRNLSEFLENNIINFLKGLIPKDFNVSDTLNPEKTIIEAEKVLSMPGMPNEGLALELMVTAGQLDILEKNAAKPFGKEYVIELEKLANKAKNIFLMPGEQSEIEKAILYDKNTTLEEVIGIIEKKIDKPKFPTDNDIVKAHNLAKKRRILNKLKNKVDKNENDFISRFG